MLIEDNSRVVCYVPAINMQYYKQEEESLQIHPSDLRMCHLPKECFTSPTSLPQPAKAVLTKQQVTCRTAVQSFKSYIINNIRSIEIVGKACSETHGKRILSENTKNN